MRLLLMLLFVLALYPARPTVAAATTMTRAEIRALPIQERPNRPGHFYGNTVRRLGGRAGR